MPTGPKIDQPSSNNNIVTDIELSQALDIIDSESTKFAQPLNVCDLNKLVMDTESAHTQRNTEWAMKAFEDWRGNRNQRSAEQFPAVENMSVQQLDKCLSYFAVEARTADESDYPGSTEYNMLCGIHCHLKEKGTTFVNFLERKDSRFYNFH